MRGREKPVEPGEASAVEARPSDERRARRTGRPRGRSTMVMLSVPGAGRGGLHRRRRGVTRERGSRDRHLDRLAGGDHTPVRADGLDAVDVHGRAAITVDVGRPGAGLEHHLAARVLLRPPQPVTRNSPVGQLRPPAGYGRARPDGGRPSDGRTSSITRQPSFISGRGAGLSGRGRAWGRAPEIGSRSGQRGGLGLGHRGSGLGSGTGSAWGSGWGRARAGAGRRHGRRRCGRWEGPSG